MRTQTRLGQSWQLGIAVLLTVVGVVAQVGRTQAQSQVVPDNTLGTEGSVVTPNVEINDLNSDRIDGGAIKGTNLFHSFEDFNVGEGKGVYFTNPQGIENILSRVTGANRSEILGTLGVLGNANLFLLNPNGIIFGKNASLDVQGSFFATTAQAIGLGKQGDFSATKPQQSSLLSVSPGALFFNQAASQQGNIINRGNLSAGKDLTLAGGNLDLQGQLHAGENLTLYATDTAKIRDSVTNPFVAAARGQVLVQGNQGVDIFALNHPESGLFSGRDTVLKSANTVGGDAHYWSGGSFRIEQLDGSLGNLFSPHDPIIRVRGDVFINSYQGASLHILAGGKVEIPDYVWIQGADPENGLLETVNLADGTTVSINGKSEPTLDIRAGINLDVIGEQTLTVAGTGSSNFIISATSIPSSADIKIGTILFANAASQPLAGRALLTNQYQPNSSLSGDIQVTQTLQDAWGAIFMDGGAGPAVAINSRGGITLDGTINTGAFYSASNTGNGGEIAISAKNNITTGNLYSNFSGDGNGGAIHLAANDGSISTGDLDSSSESNSGNTGRGGDITISAVHGNINTQDLKSSSRSIERGTAGTGGAITLEAGANIDTLSLDSSTYGFEGTGIGGAITLEAGANINTLSLNSRSYTYDRTAGAGGAITLSAGETINTQILDSSSFTNFGTAGTGGAIILSAGENINTQDIRAYSIGDTAGAGGVITLSAGENINTQSLNSNSSAFDTAGTGGAITLSAGENINIESLRSSSSSELPAELNTAGTGGAIRLSAGDTINFQEYDSSTKTYELNSRGSINSSGAKGSGNITINSNAPFVLNNGAISSDTFGYGKAGDIQIRATSISLTNGGQLSASSHNLGAGGNITLVASDTVELTGETTSTPEGIFNTDVSSNIVGRPPNEYRGGYIPNGTFYTSTLPANPQFPSETVFPSGVFSQKTVGSTGGAGNLKIETGRLIINNGAAIATTTFGNGNAGDISIEARDSIKIDSGSILSGVAVGAIGKSGNVDLFTRSLAIAGGGTVQTQTLGQGAAGNIQVNATDAVTISGINPTSLTPSGLRSGSGGSNTQLGTASNNTNIGQGGDINVTTGNLSVADKAIIDAQTQTNSKGGNITVNADTLSLENGEISALTQGRGNAGKINIDVTRLLSATNSNIVTSATQSSGGELKITANDIRLYGDSDITTNVASGIGDGGKITLTADSIIAFDKSDILTFASGDGKGGDIEFNTPAFFGQNYRPAPAGTDPSTLDDNDRVDVNASGAVSGVITLPDTSFIQNGLSELPENVIDTSNLIANSCIARSGQQPQGSFKITGSGGLPTRPGDALMSTYTFGNVRSVSNANNSANSTRRPWRKGDPIVEPQGVYRLSSGQLVLSRECP